MSESRISAISILTRFTSLSSYRQIPASSKRAARVCIIRDDIRLTVRHAQYIPLL